MTDHVDRYARAAFDHARARVPLDVWKQHFREFEGTALAAKDAEIARYRDALEAAQEWIGLLRGCTGDVELTTFDTRDPRVIEAEVDQKIAAALAGGRDASL